MKKKAAAAPPPEGYVLTDEHQEYFWQCLFDWQQRLGLSDWRIVRSNVHPPKVMAMVTNFDGPQRQCTCRLGLNWKSTETTKENIEQAAVHELLHVMLHDVVSLCAGMPDEDIQSLEHRLINRLERLLVPTAKDGA